MAKKKSNSNYSLKSFESTKPSGEPFIRICLSQLESTAFKSLTKNQKTLYVYMKSQYYTKSHPDGITERFYFNKGLYDKRYNLYKNDECFRKDRNALIEKGFIKCISDGSNTMTKTVYEFSDEWQWYGTNDFNVDLNNMPASMINKIRTKEN